MIRFLKTIANALFSIMFYLAVGSCSIWGLCFPFLLIDELLPVKMSTMVIWLLCVVIAVLLVRYMMVHNRPWMPFKTVHNYTFVARLLLPLIVVALMSCSNNKTTDDTLIDAVINYERSAETILDYEGVYENDSVFNLSIGSNYLVDKQRLDSIIYERCK